MEKIIANYAVRDSVKVCYRNSTVFIYILPDDKGAIPLEDLNNELLKIGKKLAHVHPQPLEQVPHNRRIHKRKLPLNHAETKMME